MTNDDFLADAAAIGRIPALAAILDVVCQATGMGFAAVARVTEQRWVACSVVNRTDLPVQAGGELRLETTICQEIRQHRQSVIIDDVSLDKVYAHHPTPSLYGFQSYVSIPIVLPDGRFFGTLCAVDPQPHKLNTPEIVGMLELFAELVAFHIDATSRVAVTEATLVREREVSVLREQFIAVLGHDLRNPLMSISAGAERLQRRPETAAETGRIIQRSVSRMAGLIDNVLDLARGRLGGGLILHCDDEPLQPALTQVIEELRTIRPECRIDVEFAIDAEVHCDRARVAQLLSNLLGNAITHGASDQPIKVSAATRQDRFELSVTNQGPPIPPAAFERLFQPFFRGEVQRNQQGLGLGLYIASEIARAHGGDIEVCSTDAQTRFTFCMQAARIQAG